jgi:hypothetical protein
MAIIKIDGSTLTSHSSASDITGVTTTSALAEGSNLYYTEARADSRVNLQTGANLDLSSKTTTDLTEGSNLYFTDAKAVDAVEATATINLQSTTVSKDATSSQPWKSFVIQHDRSNATPYNNEANDIVWTAKTTNQEQFLGVFEIITQDVALDGNDDYVDFNNRLDFYTTSMTAGASTWHQLMTMNKDLIEFKADFRSSYNDFVVEGNYDNLVKQRRLETNNSKWDRSRSAMRCTTNADLDAGAGLEQFSNEFGVDTSYSINNSEIANIGVQVLSPDFNGDNTLAYGNGQSAFFNVQMRGDGYAPGSGPLQALRIEPWVSCVTMNTATGTSPLLIETNATAIKENKPHVFVNLTTTERNALTAESGMMIFNTTDVKLQCYDGTAWNNLH